jgi:hypothetical protein
MKRLSALMLLLFCTMLHADNREWTQEEKNWGYALLATTVIDWGQTRYISNNKNFHEDNPFLGSHPSMGRVNTHFALSLPLGYLFFDYNDDYRKDLLKIGTGVELFLVTNNARHGIGMNLKWQM